MKLFLLAAICAASAEAGYSAICKGNNVIQTAAPQCKNSEWQLTPDNEGCVEKLCPSFNDKKILATWSSNADWHKGSYSHADHGNHRCYPSKYGSWNHYLFANQGYGGQRSCDWKSNWINLDPSVVHHGIAGIDVRLNFAEWQDKDGDDFIRASIRMCTGKNGGGSCGSWQRAHKITDDPKGVSDRKWHWSLDKHGDPVGGGSHLSGYHSGYPGATSATSQSDEPGYHADLDNSHASFQLWIHSEASAFNRWYAVNSAVAYVYDCLDSGRATTNELARKNGEYVPPSCGCNPGYVMQNGDCVPDSEAPTKSPTESPTKSPTKNPTKNPTAYPTKSPTANPTHTPTAMPTSVPTTQPTNRCLVTCKKNKLIEVLHDASSGHTRHRCYMDDENNCICECTGYTY